MIVLGIGNAIVDVLVQVEDSFLTTHGLQKGTMCLIEDSQAQTLYAALGPALEMSGGSAANTMAGLAALGGKAAFLGMIGQDQLGDVFTHDIRSSGVHFTPSPRKSPLPTGRCLVMITPDGERTMNTFLGASRTLTPLDLSEDSLRACDILYLEGYLYDEPQAKDAFMKALTLARSFGKKVALTLSDTFCVERHRDDFLALIHRGVDILFANESEICALYQTTTFEDAASQTLAACPLSVLTRSALGSLILTPKEKHVIPAHPVPNILDTTGAGDLYAAGFLLGLTQNQDLHTCGTLGAKAASSILGQIGARLHTARRDGRDHILS